MAAPRTIASNAAPAGRRDQTETVGTTRPELHVVKGTRAEGNSVQARIQTAHHMDAYQKHSIVASGYRRGVPRRMSSGILNAAYPNGAAFLRGEPD